MNIISINFFSCFVSFIIVKIFIINITVGNITITIITLTAVTISWFPLLLLLLFYSSRYLSYIFSYYWCIYHNFCLGNTRYPFSITRKFLKQLLSIHIHLFLFYSFFPFVTILIPVTVSLSVLPFLTTYPFTYLFHWIHFWKASWSN